MAENLETFIEARWQNWSITSFKRYERLMDLAHDISIEMPSLTTPVHSNTQKKRHMGAWSGY